MSTRSNRSQSLSIAGAREAQLRLLGLVHRTPLVRSAYLGEVASVAAGSSVEVWLKLENQQKTGSFKPRGALIPMFGLSRAERARGVITISAGNHAQGVAWAGRMLGIPVTVVMPANASPIKVEATRGYGAEVVLHGDVPQAFARLEEVRSARGLALIHPFDSPGAMLGQSTLGLEILEDLPDADLVLVGIGGGGLAAGVAFAIKSLRPAARVIGVEPEGAAAMAKSLAAGHTVRLDSTDTIADGLAPPFVGELCFEVARKSLDSVAIVSDCEIVAGMRVLFERVKTVAEPAGAAATAALLAGRAAIAPAAKVVCIVSGGNIAAADGSRLLGPTA